MDPARRELVALPRAACAACLVVAPCLPAALAGASGADTVHVAPPTGDQRTDRASIVAALGRVAPGAVVQFAPGTYVIGEIISVTVPRVTLLGHPQGTTLRGCDPVEMWMARRSGAAATGWSSPAHSRRCAI